MRKPRRNLLLVALLALALLGALAWLALRPREPVYQGKTLSEWLARGSYEGADAVSVHAIREIGSNAIPTLLRMLRAHDSKFKLRLIGMVEKQHAMNFHFVPADSRNREAEAAFQILGPVASNAVPDLIQILNERISISSQYSTISALSSIGPSASEAEPELARTACDTNLHARVRAVATMALGKIQADPTVVFPVLMKCLKDYDSDVQFEAAMALGRIGPTARAAVPELIRTVSDANMSADKRCNAAWTLVQIQADPGLVIPALVKCLKDPDGVVRSFAAGGLGEFGVAAKPAVPALVALLKDPDADVRANAQQALKFIDPEAAAKAGIQ